MIDLIFHWANDVVLVRINGHSVLFGNTMSGNKLGDISGLKLDFKSTIKEFPDLENDIEWKEKAIERFKEHIRTLDKEEEIANYIIHELTDKGYIPKLKQVAGFRPVRLT